MNNAQLREYNRLKRFINQLDDWRMEILRGQPVLFDSSKTMALVPDDKVWDFMENGRWEKIPSGEIRLYDEESFAIGEHRYDIHLILLMTPQDIWVDKGSDGLVLGKLREAWGWWLLIVPRI